MTCTSILKLNGFPCVAVEVYKLLWTNKRMNYTKYINGNIFRPNENIVVDHSHTSMNTTLLLRALPKDWEYANRSERLRICQQILKLGKSLHISYHRKNNVVKSKINTRKYKHPRQVGENLDG